jgi:transposase InsO family protein
MGQKRDIIMFNKECWVLLDGFNEGFRAFIFKKDGKLFRRKYEDISIGQVAVNEHEVFKIDEDYYDILEYNNMVIYHEIIHDDYSRYIFGYSTKERMENKFPELFI